MPKKLKKDRDWQELMYRMFGTSSAKANDMRASGLNALLGEVSASGNVGSGAAGSAAGGVPGALVGGALGVASSLLGGLFGNHNTNKINQMNYRIMQEQNRFNAEEAAYRDWETDRKSTRLNSSHRSLSRMPSSA